VEAALRPTPVVAAIAAVAVLAAVPARAQRVEVGSEPGVDFGRYRTWAWKQDLKLPDPLSQQRVVAAVEYRMALAGFLRVEDGPDLLVTFLAEARDVHQTEAVERGYGSGIWSGVGYREIPEKHYRAGTLVLQVADAADGMVLWHAVATDTLDAEPEKSGRKIDQATRKMFERFPPGRR
jgi:hypothetical protein